MSKYMGVSMRSVAIIVALFGLAGSARMAAAQTAEQPTEPLAVVQAFLDAFQRGDVDTMRSLVDPGVRFVFNDPFSPTNESFDEFAAPPRETAVVKSITQTGPETVAAIIEISGADLPPTPFPLTLNTTWTVRGGKIIMEQSEFTPETLSFFGSMGPAPGMPTTGQEGVGSTLVLVILALGLLFIATGVLTRREFVRVRR